MSTPLLVDVWSDVVCPYCYIGSVQLSRALESFEHDTDVRFHAFELDPHATMSGDESLEDVLAAKYGISVDRARSMNQRLAQQGEALGLDFDFDRVRLANSRDAHRLLALASTQGLAPAMRERLFRAYFSEGRVISDREVLGALAQEVGVTGASELWIGDSFSAEVNEDERRARELGLSGVPAFVIDERYLVSGAQGSDALLSALAQARDSSVA